MKIRFRTEAAEDLVSAKAWYDEQRRGLGDDFVGAVERIGGFISEMPEAFPEIGAGCRRALLGRFPFALYYRVAGDTVEVIACLHTRRSPDLWQRRT